MAALCTIILASNSCTRMTAMPQAVLTNGNYKMPVHYELKKDQSRHFHELPPGLNMEFIFQEGITKKEQNSQNPPLVFVHGSYHAAWCWVEHWLPFFSGHGFDCYALSLLGQGESDTPSGAVAGTLQTHAADVADHPEGDSVAACVAGALFWWTYCSVLYCERGKSQCKRLGARRVAKVKPTTHPLYGGF